MTNQIKIGNIYITAGKWQAVKYSASGKAFGTYRNERFYLDDFMRLPKDNSYGAQYNSAFETSYFDGYLIEITSNCEQIRISYFYI